MGGYVFFLSAHCREGSDLTRTVTFEGVKQGPPAGWPHRGAAGRSSARPRQTPGCREGCTGTACCSDHPWGTNRKYRAWVWCLRCYLGSWWGFRADLAGLSHTVVLNKGTESVVCSWAALVLFIGPRREAHSAISCARNGTATLFFYQKVQLSIFLYQVTEELQFYHKLFRMLVFTVQFINKGEKISCFHLVLRTDESAAWNWNETSFL